MRLELGQVPGSSYFRPASLLIASMSSSYAGHAHYDSRKKKALDAALEEGLEPDIYKWPSEHPAQAPQRSSPVGNIGTE